MSCSYSRRRPKSKGDITVPTERTQCDSVTGAVVVTPLDAVQLAFEAVRRVYDAGAVRLSAPEVERLADMVAVYAVRTKRHRERDVEALAVLLAGMG